MDTRCSPQRIRQAHRAAEVPNFTRHFRPPRPYPAYSSKSNTGESPAMPGNDRFRLDDERRTPAGPQVQQPCPQEAIHFRESNAPTVRPSEHVFLVAEGKNLQVQRRPGLKAGAESAQEGKEYAKHGAGNLAAGAN